MLLLRRWCHVASGPLRRRLFLLSFQSPDFAMSGQRALRSVFFSLTLLHSIAIPIWGFVSFTFKIVSCIVYVIILSPAFSLPRSVTRKMSENLYYLFLYIFHIFFFLFYIVWDFFFIPNLIFISIFILCNFLKGIFPLIPFSNYSFLLHLWSYWPCRLYHIKHIYCSLSVFIERKEKCIIDLAFWVMGSLWAKFNVKYH